LVPDHTQPIRVLIADDDHRVRTALSTLLAMSTGFHVVGAASTATSALTLAREHRPTVALVDMLLPDLSDGLGLLRSMAGELQIPTIAISVDGGLKVSALSAGAAGFVDKDSTPDLLIATLRGAAS
jgi:DNA-binding NarL/FixJ family response regulator